MGKRHLEVICGNELAMQRKVNLSIQLPKTIVLYYRFIQMFGLVAQHMKLYYGYLWLMFLKQNQCSYYQKKKRNLL